MQSERSALITRGSDGKNVWFTSKAPPFKGRLFCWYCYSRNLDYKSRISSSLVFGRLGCNTCKKVPPKHFLDVLKMREMRLGEL